MIHKGNMLFETNSPDLYHNRTLLNEGRTIRAFACLLVFLPVKHIKMTTFFSVHARQKPPEHERRTSLVWQVTISLIQFAQEVKKVTTCRYLQSLCVNLRTLKGLKFSLFVW